jgi:S-DNA-T family DNA segregation ATPase FtsK/SpoIIIE
MALDSSLLYQLPPLSLLSKLAPARPLAARRDAAEKARLLEETLESFGVSAKVTAITRGPVVTRFELQPAPGVKVSRIVNLANDIALSLAAPDVRIEAPIPGKAAVGVEVPNREISLVALREVLEFPEFREHASRLVVALGKDIAGRPVFSSLDRMPHLLIAGAPGSGKSVCLNSIIFSILFKARPDEVKLLLVDPKVVELSAFNGIPHLLTPVVTDPKRAAGCLKWAVHEMERRYELFAAAGVRDIAKYNEHVLSGGRRAGPEAPATAATAAGTAPAATTAPAAPAGDAPVAGVPMPFVVIVIDELADLMLVSPVDVEHVIHRLSQMARAAGIHLVVATQRPSVDVITGVIKANIPSRIAFAVSSQVDSRTILDLPGAEKLLGRGDMLFLPVGLSKPVRVQGAFVSDREVETVVDFLRRQGAPHYVEVVTAGDGDDAQEGRGHRADALLPEAARVILEYGQASVSLLQRRLRVGYARAARLVDELEERGFVSRYDGTRPREVRLTREEYRRHFGGAGGSGGGGAGSGGGGGSGGGQAPA